MNKIIILVLSVLFTCQFANARLDRTYPLTTPGDIPFYNSSSQLARLPKGNNGDVLKTSSGLPTWVANSTTNTPEGTNLYYTAARFNSAFAGKTTTDLTEGTRLYFTDARAKASAVADALVNGVTNVAPSQNAVYDALVLKEATFTTRRELFVDFTNGSDANACSNSQPCVTIAHALSLISAPSEAAPWIIKIIGGGTDSEPLITWKPNVSLFGTETINTVLTNGITWTDSAGATGSVSIAHLTIAGQLTINNNDDGAVDLRLENVDVTGLTFAAGIASTYGEVYIHDSKLREETVISTVQRGWIMASAIFGNFHANGAAVITISGCMLSHYADIGISSAIINVGSDSIVTVVSSPSHDALTANYVVVLEVGATNAKLRHDDVSFPSSITGAVALSTIGGAQSDGTKPTCDALHRGMLWNVEGGTGVADILQVCQKNSSNVYGWITK